MIKYKLVAPLTNEQIIKLNQISQTNKVLIIYENTKGLTKEQILKLNNNITISITGGLSPTKEKFNNEHYQERTYYSPKELVAIIDKFEKIERKINPLWTEEEKMMFVYQQLCEYLTYDENEFNRRDASRNLLGLITGKSVCAGCAMIFKEAMDRIGIKCYYQNVRHHHAWNIVEINGKYYGLELTWDVYNKKNNVCGFQFFAREHAQKFYSNEHHNLAGEKQEKLFNLEEIPFQKLQKMYTTITEERISYKKTDYINGEETCAINDNKIIIKNNIPISVDNILMTYIRDDKTSFVIIPTEKVGKGLYEYIYLEYLPETKQVRHTKIYSETKFVSYDYEMRDNIANNLLSKERVKDKINNYNGYVGYVVKGTKGRYYREEIEKELNIHR